MAGEKYVPSGVWLTCDKGTIASQFTVTPKSVKLYGQDWATEADLMPMINIMPFGVCSVDGSLCTPLPVQWLDVLADGVKITELKPLLDCSQCLCVKTGKAIIHMSKGAADNHLAAQGIQEVANVAKEVSLWAFVGGVALGVAGVACAFTGVGAVATPFLLAAAGECMTIAAVSFEIAIIADVTAFAIEPNEANGWVIVGDAAAMLTGKIIGKGLGVLAKDLAATGTGRKIAVAVEDAANAKPRLKVEGEKEGGVGKWTKEYNRKGKGMKYQTDKSGTKSEYQVATKNMKSGKKNFDDYDPKTKEFIDYKDWNNGYPPKGTSMEKSAIKDAINQAKIAQEHGTITRWEFSTKESAERMQKIIEKNLDDNLQQYIKIVVNPK